MHSGKYHSRDTHRVVRIPATKSAAVQHVLVTGHSGSGKSTYAAKTGLPVIPLDKDPEVLEFLEQQKRWAAASPDGSLKLTPEIVAQNRDIANRAIARALAAKVPSAIEGTYLLDADPTTLGAHRKVLVGPGVEEVLRRRVSRQHAKDLSKGRIWSDERAEGVRLRGRQLMDAYRDGYERWRAAADVEKVAKADDKDRAVQLAKVVYQATKDPYLKDNLYHGMFRRPIVRDGTVVGFTTPRKGKEDGSARVGAIFISPEHRNKGYARDAIRDIVKERGRSYAFINDGNKSSQKAFAAAGFTKSEREERWGGGHWWRHSGAVDKSAEVVLPDVLQEEHLKNMFLAALQAMKSNAVLRRPASALSAAIKRTPEEQTVSQVEQSAWQPPQAKTAELVLLAGKAAAGKTTTLRGLRQHFDEVISTDTWDYDANPAGPPKGYDKQKNRQEKVDRALAAHRAGKRVLLEGYYPNYQKYPQLHGKFDKVVHLEPGVIRRNYRLIKRTLQRGRPLSDVVRLHKDHMREGVPALAAMRRQESNHFKGNNKQVQEELTKKAYAYWKLATEEEKPQERYAPTLKPWFQPFEHQVKAIDRAYANHGRMILAHGTGLGKTAAGIALREKLYGDGKSKGALVVVPSGLRHNFGESGLDKFTEGVKYQIVGSKDEASKDPKVVYLGSEKHVDKGGPQYTIVSYDMFRKDPVGLMLRTGADTLMFDEFHATRNESSQTFRAAMAARQHAKTFIGLTASPVNNHPRELATLLTISEGRRLLTPKQFEHAFMRTVGYAKGFRGGKKKEQEVVNVEHLVNLLYPRMDVATTESLRPGEMPRKDVQEVKVAMSDEQYKLYQLALDDVGKLEEYLLRRDPNVSIKDAEQLFAQLSEARKVANSISMGRTDISLEESAEKTPKVKKLLDDAQAKLEEDPQNQVVLYSNLVRGGVDVLSAGLKARGIEHGIFTGKGTEVGGKLVDSQSRQQDVRDYKDGKLRAIIISGAGAEGLDLKDSSAFYALDGHFNPERIQQAEARAVRLGGQQFRDPDKRQVDVRRYINTVPESVKPGIFGKLVGSEPPMTTDEWMYAVADRKRKKIDTVITSLSKPHKYIRKYRDADGDWRYVYPREDGNKDSYSLDVKTPRSEEDVAAPQMVSVPMRKNPWWSKLKFWSNWGTRN